VVFIRETVAAVSRFYQLHSTNMHLRIRYSIIKHKLTMQHKITLLKTVLTLSSIALITCLNSCKSDDTTTTPATTTVPTLFSANFKSAVTLSSDGTSITAKSKGVPDHVSPYWGVGNTLYEAQTAGRNLTPGNLAEQNFVMVIPISPVAATTKEATSLGPIGMALNGVAIYNDREGGNVQVDAGTLLTFDRAGGHGGPGALYHYHFNGDFTSKDDAKLIGWLRDGFPIYGRKCSSTGTYATGLDTNGGHTTTTTEYTTATYHYHCSNVSYMNSVYYVLKSGSYHGTKGTFTF
jgi:YHYH protein